MFVLLHLLICSQVLTCMVYDVQYTSLVSTAKSSRPFRDGYDSVVNVFQWKTSAESLVVFLVSIDLYFHHITLTDCTCIQIYMYCVWNGWIIQLVLFIAVLKLTLNYLYIRCDSVSRKH